jgi:hypothetical protein
MKPITLKRNVKLGNIKWDIPGVDSDRPLLQVLSAIGIGAIIGLLVFIFGLAFISYLIK